MNCARFEVCKRVFQNSVCSMDSCISEFIEKKIDEAQNEITKEIEHSTIAKDKLAILGNHVKVFE